MTRPATIREPSAVGAALALAIATVLFSSLIWATAQAHSGLAAASPGPGSTVGGTVERIQIFYGDIILEFDGTVTLQSTGEVVPATAEMISDIEAVITLDEPLSVDGEYAVRHTITSFDTDVVEAAYLFSYEAGAPPPRLEFVEEADDDGGLPWWGWVVIGLGGIVLLVLTVRLLLAVRRRAALAESVD